MRDIIKSNYKICQTEINGRNIYSKQFQNGEPTVIFETGLGDTSSIWDSIQREISLRTSTMSYDRAGLGKSDKPNTPRTCADLVDDLYHLVVKESIQPPFILVGHSFGGLVLRLFASLYPKMVIGLILVDAAAENKELAYDEILPYELKNQNREYYLNPMLNFEKIDKVHSYQEIEKHKCTFDFPITVITRGLPDNYDKELPNDSILKIEKKLQNAFLNLSHNSKQIIASKSRHNIHVDQPSLIIESITEMIQKEYKH